AIDNFNRQMRNFNGNVSKIYALRGEGVNVNFENWTNKGYANFTDNGTASGASNWTVIENVSSSNITVNISSISSGMLQIGLINISKPSWINITTPTTTPIRLRNATTADPYSVVFRNGNTTSGNYSINGTASGRSFTRARDYILNATLTLSTSRVRANITIPVSVPW
ncbi:MAG: hypothetical protein PHG00_17940, partial [Methylococcales bacterium]|nr:hypothetical protein [Methylococcales bacterium]